MWDFMRSHADTIHYLTETGQFFSYKTASRHDESKYMPPSSYGAKIYDTQENASIMLPTHLEKIPFKDYPKPRFQLLNETGRIKVKNC